MSSKHVICNWSSSERTAARAAQKEKRHHDKPHAVMYQLHNHHYQLTFSHLGLASVLNKGQSEGPIRHCEARRFNLNTKKKKKRQAKAINNIGPNRVVSSDKLLLMSVFVEKRAENNLLPAESQSHCQLISIRQGCTNTTFLWYMYK